MRQKVPAGHVTGAEDPDRHTAPFGHAVAFTAPAGQKNWTGHWVETPLTQKKPAAHGTGAEKDARQ